ncbi:sugar transferase [Telmatobacter bradus]|uniref:sugar transferase n=1 Tax=Telmatobacter bradus TaxID=474953 RepID=UPI003B431468
MAKQMASVLEYSPLVAVLDLTMVHGGAFLALAATGGQGVRLYLHLLPLLSVTAMVCYSRCGFYRSWSRRRLLELMQTLVLAQALYATVWMALCGWEPGWLPGRSVLALSVVLQLALLGVLRTLLRAAARASGNLENGLIVAGDADRAAELCARLGESAVSWLQVAGSMTPAEFLAADDDRLVEGAVLVDQAIFDKLPLVRKAARLGKSVFVIPGVYELWMAGARPALNEDLLMLRLSPPYLHPAPRAVKRLLDVAGAMLILVLAAPLMLLVFVLIRLTSRGPALYRQTRVGANGAEYELLKFRTMQLGAELRTGPVMACRDDPRLTTVGSLLRAMRIDELPQLCNVITGSMSLIGPRPERPHFVAQLREQLPGYDLRLAVKPGITGLAQVNGSYWTRPEQKLRLDLMYIYNYSLMLDVKILLRTLLIVLEPGRAVGGLRQTR